MSYHDIANVQIKTMTKASSAEAFSLACKVFVESSVLHNAVKISLDEYRTYMHSAFEGMWAQGLSVVATDLATEKLIGCLVACDYASLPQGNVDTPKPLMPVNALLQELDKQYQRTRKIDSGQYMLVDMAVVTAEAQGLGLYKKLREHAHKLGRDAGFRYVLGELSSAATQHLCINRFGHKVLAEIDYASFEFDNSRPFAEIKEPASIVLVEGEL